MNVSEAREEIIKNLIMKEEKINKKLFERRENIEQGEQKE